MSSTQSSTPLSTASSTQSSNRNKAAAKSQSQKNWLLLTDYASKYRVSVSTLRRRIKAGAQEHRFDNGKYYLPEPTLHEEGFGASHVSPGLWSDRASHEMHLKPDIGRDGIGKPAYELKVGRDLDTQPPAGAAASIQEMPAPAAGPSPVAQASVSHDTTEESLLRTTTRLVDELKRAYTQILQEKEEQILLLKEEIADLKTLVRVLEFDRERRLELQNHDAQK